MADTKYIAQFSVDVADDGDTHAEDIAQALEQLGFTVVGCLWKATWDAEEYDKGLPPIASD